MVANVSGAKLFFVEACFASRFRIDMETKRLWRFGNASYSPPESIRDMAALQGRLDVLQWAVV